MNYGVEKILHLILDEIILKINEVSLAITAALLAIIIYQVGEVDEKSVKGNDVN